MFTKKIKAENEALKDELYMLQQSVIDVAEELMMLKLDTSSKVVSSNQNFAEEFGVGYDEVVGQHILELVPRELRQTEHFARMKEALKQTKVWSGAWQVRNADGDDLWFRATICPIRRRSGELSHINVYANNLTRTISQSRECESLIDAMQRSTAVIEFDPEGHILHANELFLGAVGYRLQDIRGKHHRIFCSKDVYEAESYQQFWRQLKEGKYVADRFKRIDSRGQEVWLEASYNPVKDANGHCYKVVKFATVITDQIQQAREVANAASVAYETSQITDVSAKRGLDVMNNTSAMMVQLAEQMTHASNGVSELDQQSQIIAKIIQSISGIAEQTNLLALNAAIEAARAGDQGRGFAVVADEVRQLASRTTKATGEIVEVVGQNQELTARAVELIEASKSQAEDARQLVDEANSVINEIQEGARQVVNAVSRFSDRLH